MKIKHIIPITAGMICLVVAIIGGLYFGTDLYSQKTPRPSIGGPFELIDQNGKIVRRTDLAGRPMAITFGYTHCPQICPTTLQNMARWRANLGKNAELISFVFVTIDPARDTSQILKEYVSHFDARIIALSGSASQIAKIARDYRVFVKKAPSVDGSYLLDHSTITYLMDAKGRYQASISYGEAEDESLRKLRILLAQH